VPADLKVVFVKIPAPLLAPCPQSVEVTILNDGPDPADPAPFDVTLEVFNPGDNIPDTTWETIVTSSEAQRLPQ
jgi:hypothetical protein